MDAVYKRKEDERPGCPLYIIHDSTNMTEEHVECVKMVLKEELEKFVVVAPVLNIDSWI